VYRFKVNMVMVAGVYLITIKPTKDTYVGSSGDVVKRWRSYVNTAESKACLHGIPSGLRESISNYSPADLAFEILEVTGHAKEKEAFWIRELNPTLNKVLPSSYVIACEKEESRQAWDDEMSRLSAWWASRSIHAKQAIKWLHDEDLRKFSVEYILNQGGTPKDDLLKPIPYPKTSDECYVKHKGLL